MSPSTTSAPGQTATSTGGSCWRRWAPGASLGPALQQEVGVAVRDQSHQRRTATFAGRAPAGCGETLRIAAEDHRLTDRRSHRGERASQPMKDLVGQGRLDTGPLGVGFDGRRAEDVQVPAGQFEAGVPRIDVGVGHDLHRRLAGALPADQQPTGRAAVSQGVPGSRRALDRRPSRSAPPHRNRAMPPAGRPCRPLEPSPPRRPAAARA